MAQHNTTQHGTIRHNTIQHSTARTHGAPLGNRLGLNDPTTWCNATCSAVRLHRHGMSGGAIAGAAVGAAAGAALLMAAGFLLYRHNVAQTVGANYATSEMHGRAQNNPTFLTPSTPSSNPHYVQMQ